MPNETSKYGGNFEGTCETGLAMRRDAADRADRESCDRGDRADGTEDGATTTLGGEVDLARQPLGGHPFKGTFSAVSLKTLNKKVTFGNREKAA